VRFDHPALPTAVVLHKGRNVLAALRGLKEALDIPLQQPPNVPKDRRHMQLSAEEWIVWQRQVRIGTGRYAPPEPADDKDGGPFVAIWLYESGLQLLDSRGYAESGWLDCPPRVGLAGLPAELLQAMARFTRWLTRYE